MSEIIKVRINSDGITAKEVNEMLTVSEYQEAFKVGMEGLLSYEEAFIEAENKLRTFKIANVGEVYEDGGVDIFYSGNPKIRYKKTGLECQAEILDTNKLTIRIL